MNLTQKLLAFTLLGAEWVLWLLIILSIASVAIMIERALYFRSLRIDFDGARKKAKDTRGPEAEVALAGLQEVERGPEAVAAAMMGAKSRVKLRLEKNLAFLGTLGANAPFIGLFGTVLGIIRAFRDLAVNQSGGVGVVMAGISEALVATAVGLLVAIPAVVAFNFYNRRVRSVAAHIDSMAQVVLAEVHGDEGTDKSERTATEGKKKAEAR